MGKKGEPQAPDPVTTANAQTQSNRETAITQTGLNAVNQVTPNGSLTYSQNGAWSDGTPRFTATTTLDPVSEALFRTGQRTSQNLASIGERQSQAIGDTLAQPFSTAGMPTGGAASSVRAPSLQTTLDPTSYASGRQAVEDALFSRLEPRIAQDRASMESDLVNRGIRVGSDAYSAAARDFGQNVNDARTAAILNAGQEQSRLQGMDINAGNFTNSGLQQGFNNDVTRFGLQNTERDRAINEALTSRNQLLNENIGLATGTQVQQPQFASTPQTGVAGTDIAGLIQNQYANQLSAYNTQQSNLMGGLFGLGRAAIGLI